MPIAALSIGQRPIGVRRTEQRAHNDGGGPTFRCGDRSLLPAVTGRQGLRRYGNPWWVSLTLRNCPTYPAKWGTQGPRPAAAYCERL